MLERPTYPTPALRSFPTCATFFLLSYAVQNPLELSACFGCPGTPHVAHHHCTQGERPPRQFIRAFRFNQHSRSYVLEFGFCELYR